MELKAGGVCGEGAARQPRPFDSALTFLDPLLRRSALVVEGVDGLGWTHQVGDDEANLRIKLACIPLDFRHHSAHHSDVTVSGWKPPAAPASVSHRLRRHCQINLSRSKRPEAGRAITPPRPKLHREIRSLTGYSTYDRISTARDFASLRLKMARQTR